MKTRTLILTQEKSSRSRGGYLIIETLVYLSLLFAIMGVGFASLYFCVDSSVALRRNADDIAKTLQVGERWRADIRAAQRGIEHQFVDKKPVLRLKGAKEEVFYTFSGGELLRRSGDGPWIQILSRVKSSDMHSQSQFNLVSWRWDLELQPESKGRIKPGRVRPLFTFMAVPATAQAR